MQIESKHNFTSQQVKTVSFSEASNDLGIYQLVHGNSNRIYLITTKIGNFVYYPDFNDDDKFTPVVLSDGGWYKNYRFTKVEGMEINITFKS